MAYDFDSKLSDGIARLEQMVDNLVGYDEAVDMGAIDESDPEGVRKVADANENLFKTYAPYALESIREAFRIEGSKESDVAWVIAENGGMEGLPDDEKAALEKAFENESLVDVADVMVKKIDDTLEGMLDLMRITAKDEPEPKDADEYVSKLKEATANVIADVKDLSGRMATDKPAWDGLVDKAIGIMKEKMDGADDKMKTAIADRCADFGPYRYAKNEDGSQDKSKIESFPPFRIRENGAFADDMGFSVRGELVSSDVPSQAEKREILSAISAGVRGLDLEEAYKRDDIDGFLKIASDDYAGYEKWLAPDARHSAKDDEGRPGYDSVTEAREHLDMGKNNPEIVAKYVHFRNGDVLGGVESGIRFEGKEIDLITAKEADTTTTKSATDKTAGNYDETIKKVDASPLVREPAEKDAVTKEGGFIPAANDSGKPMDAPDDIGTRTEKAELEGKAVGWKATGNEKVDQYLNVRNEYLAGPGSLTGFYRNSPRFNFYNFKTLETAYREGVKIEGRDVRAFDVVSAADRFLNCDVASYVSVLAISTLIDALHGRNEDEKPDVEADDDKAAKDPPSGGDGDATTGEEPKDGEGDAADSDGAEPTGASEDDRADGAEPEPPDDLDDEVEVEKPVGPTVTAEEVMEKMADVRDAANENADAAIGEALAGAEKPEVEAGKDGADGEPKDGADGEPKEGEATAEPEKTEQEIKEQKANEALQCVDRNFTYEDGKLVVDIEGFHFEKEMDAEPKEGDAPGWKEWGAVMEKTSPEIVEAAKAAYDRKEIPASTLDRIQEACYSEDRFKSGWILKARAVACGNNPVYMLKYEIEFEEKEKAEKEKQEAEEKKYAAAAEGVAQDVGEDSWQRTDSVFGDDGEEIPEGASLLDDVIPDDYDGWPYRDDEPVDEYVEDEWPVDENGEPIPQEAPIDMEGEYHVGADGEVEEDSYDGYGAFDYEAPPEWTPSDVGDAGTASEESYDEGDWTEVDDAPTVEDVADGWYADDFESGSED